MEIGQHVLQGIVRNLDKPMMIMEKVDGHMVVEGFVKRKVIFDNRPQPLRNTFTKG
jgi:hypothetical protein